ncbi:MAG: hypothetical protein WDZ64_01205 [Parcubacteria group bacterium]
MDNNSSGAGTVLLVIVIILLLGFGVWWFAVREEDPADTNGGINVQLNMLDSRGESA